MAEHFPVTRTKRELYTYLTTFDVEQYQKTRNCLQGTVSRLSPYITRGVITLPEIRDCILQRNSYWAAEKFIQELAWREYWHEVWYAKQEAIFSDLRFSREDWEHRDLVATIVMGTTGISTIDQAVRVLYETGYMHNHARMWTAMLACNVAKAHWYDMGRWLYYHLYDGDLASNMLSWQWVAGTNAGKRYVANQKLINGCSNISQTRTFLTMSREKVGQGPVPTELQATLPFHYQTTYPVSDNVAWKASKVFLYSPWTLNPDWRFGEVGERVLVLEPRWFDRFPVSSKVLEFILGVARTQVPGCRVYVGNVADIQFGDHTLIFSQSYPAHLDWPGSQDTPDRLFPEVSGYYPSFFKFWQACQG